MTRPRAALATALLLAAAAGLLGASSLASGATSTLLDTVTGTDTAVTATDTTTTTTETATTTTTTTTTTPGAIADGVTVGGIPVGGMDAAAATSAVKASFALPVRLDGPGFRLLLRPAQVGAQATVWAAVARALKAPAGKMLALPVRVSSARVQRYLRGVAKRYDRTAIDSTVVLRSFVPFVSKGRPGRSLRRAPTQHAILLDLRLNRRTPVKLTGTAIAQAVSRTTFGPVIVIRNRTHTLSLYDGMRFVRRFGVATGQPAYPTPNGRFSIVVMWKNPWWYPPASPWAVGAKPVPPGPGNPLGTRWMGLSAPGVGIHGTPEPGSIGYSLSHGCIRMRIPEAEWLFQHVRVGATVFIVPA
jgi:lipoprotein-anchoring transpeptidase ErfK/SrfK